MNNFKLIRENRAMEMFLSVDNKLNFIEILSHYISMRHAITNNYFIYPLSSSLYT